MSSDADKQSSSSDSLPPALTSSSRHSTAGAFCAPFGLDPWAPLGPRDQGDLANRTDLLGDHVDLPGAMPSDAYALAVAAAGSPTILAGLTMRSKLSAPMYPVARAACRRVVPSSLALCAMAEALS